MKADLPLLLCVKDVAVRLGVSVGLVYELLATRQLGHVRLTPNGRYYVTSAQIQDYIQRRTVPAAIGSHSASA